jgi:hypothetical protein
MGIDLSMVDVETLGTEDHHVIWSVTAIRVGDLDPRSGFQQRRDQLWTIEVSDAELVVAQPEALRINRFYELYDRKDATERHEAAWEIAKFTAGSQLVAINPTFDIKKMEKFLKSESVTPAWYYEPIDVKNVAMGTLIGRKRVPTNEYDPPWSTDKTAELLGLDIADYDRHTSSGDALLCLNMYLACYGIAA